MKQAAIFVCSLLGGPLDGHVSFTLWDKEVKAQLPGYGLPGFAIVKGMSRTSTSYRLIWDQLDFSKPYFGEPHPFTPADLLPEAPPTITHCA